jgi:putative N6-adenine-specific DNA methylase
MSETPAPPVNEKALARRVKDHVVGRRHEFFAVVHPGFESVALGELAGLGIAALARDSGGIVFQGKLDDAWRVNLGAGTVSRLLMRLGEFKATGFGEFRSKLAALPWELHLADRARVAFSVSAGRSRLWHEGKLEEEAERAIAARLAAYGRRAEFGAAAGPDHEGGQTVFLRLDENRCQASLDSSGPLLYRRGRGKFTEQAPLRETLACGVLRAAGIERYRVVLDPFCGSGTFALEAGAILAGRLVNADRAFAFQGWPSYRPAHFQHLKGELEKTFREKAPTGARKIYCSDLDAGAVTTAAHNVELAGLGSLVEIDQADFFHLHPPAANPADVLLVMNPPYGARQEQGADLAAFYRRIGEKVRRDYASCGHAIIVPGLELEKALGLPHEQKILFHNGGISVALLIKHSVQGRKLPA